MSTEEPVNTSYAKAPNQTLTTGGTSFAYRELGPRGGVPVVFLVHLAGTLDNWDPRIIEPIARNRHVVAFDNVGVGASSGTVPRTMKRPPTTPTASSPLSASPPSTSSRSPWVG